MVKSHACTYLNGETPVYREENIDKTLPAIIRTERNDLENLLAF